jgi:hypothetical protein
MSSTLTAGAGVGGQEADALTVEVTDRHVVAGLPVDVWHRQCGHPVSAFGIRGGPGPHLGAVRGVGVLLRVSMLAQPGDRDPVLPAGHGK